MCMYTYILIDKCIHTCIFHIIVHRCIVGKAAGDFVADLHHVQCLDDVQQVRVHTRVSVYIRSNHKNLFLLSTSYKTTRQHISADVGLDNIHVLVYAQDLTHMLVYGEVGVIPATFLFL